MKISKLQNRAMRIINFEELDAEVDPLDKRENILKIADYIEVQNVLPVHDYLTNKLPKCFQDHYFERNEVNLIIQTRYSELGCLFIPSKNTTMYGLQSISQQCIYNWNFFTKLLKIDLLQLPRFKLKKLLHQYFMSLY